MVQKKRIRKPVRKLEVYAKPVEYETDDTGRRVPILDLTPTVRVANQDERKEWDKKCELCGSKCMMENPEVYDIEVFECQNPQCRAQFTIKTFYDKKGKFTGEEYLGKTMGSVT
jgi:hypothetical protein